MIKLNADLVVVGAGSTGCGIARDAAMRGFDVVLVDKGDIAQGTSGRFHGLLHSGARYAVSDPALARECAAENAIIKLIQPDAVEDTGGLFVSFEGDDQDYAEQFLAACAASGLVHEEITPAQARRDEPRLAPRIVRAIRVCDAAVDGWALSLGAVRSATAYGARILTYTRVAGIDLADGQVAAVRCQDRKNGRNIVIDTRFVINAAGPWVSQVAALMGIDGIDVTPAQGIMLASGHRLTSRVLNRLRPLSDGDIMVPARTVSTVGTTDEPTDDPDRLTMPRARIQEMLSAGEALTPGFRAGRVLHSWVGARPLIEDSRAAAGERREMGRGMLIFDHAERDGVSGALTVAGGKLTTYRLMAERAVDLMCRRLGDERPCRTAEEAVPDAVGPPRRITGRWSRLEAARTAAAARAAAGEACSDQPTIQDPVLCECELVGRSALIEPLAQSPDWSLDDLRRRTRLGMGPCQGGFCAARGAGAACQQGLWSADRASAALRHFLRNRWIGQWSVLYGDALRQAALDDRVLYGSLGLDLLPADEAVIL
ncbi:MAG: anaerobic glycerol-3-phosphate dehydrogenase subunit A [Bifidobacteriaceae bacterium]|nr:anaerobic glycerol-3-phosphate dehydrogenase subunit A [Bifidobacteriaceae bacterium]